MPETTDIAQVLSRLARRHVEAPWEQRFRFQLDRLLGPVEDGTSLLRPILDPKKETRGVLAIAGAGGGKTWTVHRTLARHPGLQSPGEGRQPYLSSIVPSGATYKSMAQQLLTDSGYAHDSGRRPGWETWQMFRHRMRMLGTAVLWIDEAHDLFQREKENILPSLKSLMQGDGAVVLVLTGTEALDAVIRSDDQVKRRFTTVRIPEVSVEQDGANFEALIQEYCAIAGLDALVEPDLVGRLAVAARSRFGRMISTIVMAIEQALVMGDDILTMDHFAEAYDHQEGCEPHRNVFLSLDWNRIDPDGSPILALPTPARWRGR